MIGFVLYQKARAHLVIFWSFQYMTTCFLSRTTYLLHGVRMVMRHLHIAR